MARRQGQSSEGRQRRWALCGAALALTLTASLGCAGRNQGGAGPRYKSVEQLRGCAAHECVEASLELRRWADASHHRGRLVYHCDPGSELDGPPDPAVERMILVIHGQVELRDIPGLAMSPGLGQLLAMRSAMSRARELDPSVDEAKIAIIAPTFQRAGEWQPYSDADPSVWAWKGSSFNTGSMAEEGRGKAGVVKAEPVSSFQILDEFLRAGLLVFPNLKQIVIVGHSAGGQAVHRYALLGVGVHEHLEAEGVALRYVVTNPGMYAFPLRRRKLPPGRSSVPPGAGKGDTGDWRWGVPAGCPGYDDWGFGLARLDEARAQEAVAFAIDAYLRPVDRKLARRGVRHPGEAEWQEAARQALLRQYAAREIWHLQAGDDVAPTFSDNCRATLQGRSRFERFSNFHEAWASLLGIPAPSLHFVEIEHLHDQHNSRAVYVSDAGVHLLFH